MNYKLFTIKDYRCFSSKQTLHFGIPIKGKLGSGITYIVGSNNSGKTTLIEGLWLNENQRIKASEMKTAAGPEFCLYDATEQLIRKVSLIRSGSYTLKEEPKLRNNELFEVVTSRRHWQSSANNNQTRSAILETTIKDYNPRTQHDLPVASLLKDKIMINIMNSLS